MRSNSFAWCRLSLRIRAPSARSLLALLALRGPLQGRAGVWLQRHRSDKPLSSYRSRSRRIRGILVHFRISIDFWRKSSFCEFRSPPRFIGKRLDLGGPVIRPFRARRIVAALLLLCSELPGPPAQAQDKLLQGIWWGEAQGALLAHYGKRAVVLQRPIDFGDSYTQIVLRDVLVGGVPLIAFFQIDKATGGLKRVQLERQRHGVNPPAFRGVISALQAEYGVVDAACSIRRTPKNGYQEAAELDWSRNGNLIRAVFRDSTIEAVEGCLGDLTAGPCGLTGQLFVRVSPLAADAPSCHPH
jgi:hypothetical protein